LKDISYILLSCWTFIRDFPPSSSAYQSNPNGGGGFQRVFPENMSLESYLHSLKQILRTNIEKLGSFYSRFVIH